MEGWRCVLHHYAVHYLATKGVPTVPCNTEILTLSFSCMIQSTLDNLASGELLW